MTNKNEKAVKEIYKEPKVINMIMVQRTEK